MISQSYIRPGFNGRVDWLETTLSRPLSMWMICSGEFIADNCEIM